jgi:hypothetical protein
MDPLLCPFLLSIFVFSCLHFVCLLQVFPLLMPPPVTLKSERRIITCFDVQLPSYNFCSVCFLLLPSFKLSENNNTSASGQDIYYYFSKEKGQEGRCSTTLMPLAFGHLIQRVLV